MPENSNSLVNVLEKAIETIPGIINFSFVDDQKKKPININEIKNNELEIAISVIISRNVSTRTLSKQIYKSVVFVLKNKNLSLNKLNLYIRGAR